MTNTALLDHLQSVLTHEMETFRKDMRQDFFFSLFERNQYLIRYHIESALWHIHMLEGEVTVPDPVEETTVPDPVKEATVPDPVEETTEFVCDKYELREGKKNPNGLFRFFDRSCNIRRVEKIDKQSFLYHLFHFDESISIHRMTTEAKQALFEGDWPNIYSADHRLEPHQLTRCLKPGEDSKDFVFMKCFRFGPSCYRVVLEQRSTNEIVLRSIFKPNVHRIPGLAKRKEKPTQDSEWAFDPRGSPLFNHWDLMILKHYYCMITVQELEEYNSVFIEEVSLL